MEIYWAPTLATKIIHLWAHFRPTLEVTTNVCGSLLCTQDKLSWYLKTNFRWRAVPRIVRRILYRCKMADTGKNNFSKTWYLCSTCMYVLCNKLRGQAIAWWHYVTLESQDYPNSVVLHGHCGYNCIICYWNMIYYILSAKVLALAYLVCTLASLKG